jgi:glycosyltransferase involved in cell wall biosynthesis
LFRLEKGAFILTDTPHYVGMMAYLGAVLFGRELVYRARGDSLAEYAERGEQIHAWFFRKLMMPKCTKVIAVSHYLKRALVAQGFPETKIHVVPTPQSTQAASPLPMEERASRVLIVTSFKLRGKCAALHKILPELDVFLSNHGHFTVAIAGGGRYLNDFALAASRCRSADRIQLMGFVNPIADLYRSSFALVHVSDLDAYPSVINEARSFGTPVIAGNNGGMPEQDVKGDDGIVLSETGKLANAIEELQQPDVWKRLSVNGRAKVLHDHSLERVGEQLKEVLGRR